MQYGKDAEFHDSLEHRIVHLGGRWQPGPEEKKRFQCTDVVTHIIDFDTDLKRTLAAVSAAADQADAAGYGSAPLTQLRQLMATCDRELKAINTLLMAARDELTASAMAAYGLRPDCRSAFEVAGYQFMAVPNTQKMNYIVEDLFSGGDIANINMPLTDVEFTGTRKPRKGQEPSRLIIELWQNGES
ncbi:hypothetical protein [Cedecea sp. P7760]|uniref:hypothetical protein n=1 Tax=Cedecea sp. P7760 TaxID=2726983 RepID=UPI0015A291A4|nr:hypothetical protein [Cedecea sp. P7760]NWC63964.1 hypothetical protein [Cedecea sp. P7760]